LSDFELGDRTLKIYGTQPTNAFLAILVSLKIEVIQINKEAEDLETFFMQMIGGQTK
jgi:hypothetical protein